MGPRVFTVREANALIPRIAQCFIEFDGIRDRLRRVKAKIDVLEMLWADEVQSESNPDNREYRHYVEEVEKSKQAYEAVTRRLVEMEVVLKSVDTGLIDFYGVVESRLVFLCWKRGEKAVDWYHHLEDGYPGRREIPAECRAE